jgi:hypothetical protein
MSSYDFIISNIRFSYSAVSTFDTCPYSYKLTYIDAVPRANNFYGEFGTFMHDCFEKYFTGQLESYELSQYYRNNYGEYVKDPAPVPPMGLDEKYKVQGEDFFNHFSFNKEDYDILLIEDKVDFEVNGIKMVAKPDLVLKDKATGMNILYDYKTSAPFRIDKRTGKEITDTKKMEGYYKQMFLYTYALRKHKEMHIDEIILWFARIDRKVSIPWSIEREDETFEWFNKSIVKIADEEKFIYNNSNPYFCNNLCSVRAFCEFH